MLVMQNQPAAMPPESEACPMYCAHPNVNASGRVDGNGESIALCADCGVRVMPSTPAATFAPSAFVPPPVRATPPAPIVPALLASMTVATPPAPPAPATLAPPAAASVTGAPTVSTVGDVNVAMDGSNFCWTVSEIEYRVLRDAAIDSGFKAHLPDAPEPKAALQAACKAAKCRDPRTLLVRDAALVGATGFLVVHEHADPADARKAAYTEVFRVTLDAQHEPTSLMPIMAPQADCDIAASVLLDYKRQLTLAPGAMVGRFLTDVVRSLGAVAIRPTGGIYWMPRNDAARFQALRVLLNTRTGGACTIFRQNVVTDDDGVITLAAAVSAELDSEISRIEREITCGIQRGSGYVPLGERAMKARVAEISALIARAARFSSMLGRSIDTAKLVAAKGEAEEALAILSA